MPPTRWRRWFAAIALIVGIGAGVQAHTGSAHNSHTRADGATATAADWWW
jgi:hypothetical protein